MLKFNDYRDVKYVTQQIHIIVGVTKRWWNGGMNTYIPVQVKTINN